MQQAVTIQQRDAVKNFLAKCQQSSNDAYNLFKLMLSDLEDRQKQREARRFLEDLFLYLKHIDPAPDKLAAYSFSIDALPISNAGSTDEHLLLLQLPSIFAPEEWSFTFYEGLSRYGKNEFHGKMMTELGSGNGWISIALAKYCMPEKIYGLDINPRAKICAKINLYLNGLDAQGNAIIDEEGKTLFQRVEFATSDLLQYCKEIDVTLDCIVGCIPQVLSPDEEVLSSIVPENATDDYLYSLSNYCGKQGHVEDQFGLGLIAKALEESLDRLAPFGKIIFNMGGRPGTAVLDRLFERRGFAIKKVWQRKIHQAGDTDILPLVQIERKTPHRFEFFMGLNSQESISATTALHFAQAGGRIAHSLIVYEGTSPHHVPVKTIFGLLQEPAYESAKHALDLCFDEDEVADEKIHYLASLAHLLKRTEAFPYGETEGIFSLRERLSHYLRSYFNIPISEKHLLVAPNVPSLLQSAMHLYKPKLTLADRDFARDLPASYTKIAENAPVRVIEAPRHAHLLVELIQRLRPQLAMVKLADFEYRSPDAFIRLLETAANCGTRLLVDISQHFELSSHPQTNGLLQYLAENPLPPHAGIMCGLVKNRVYSDLSIAFLLTENQELISQLSNCAEFTYSRTAYLSQHYYASLIHELLKFQMLDLRESLPARAMQADMPKGFIQPSESALHAFAHPCLESAHLPLSGSTIRLDYGENELASPQLLKSYLYEAFVRQHISAEEVNLDPEIAALLQRRLGLSPSVYAKVVYGNGVAPLFASLAEGCLQEEGTFLFPEGCYGYFYATAQFYGLKIGHIPTNREHQFKITPAQLEAAMQGVERPWVYLNFPVVNPTGAIYTPSELTALLNVLKKRQAKVVIDSIFAGLEFGEAVPYSLDAHIWQMPLVILGGISKEYAAGGLRLGYAYTQNDFLHECLKQHTKAQPHHTVKYAMKRLLQAQENNAGLLSDLRQQRAVLAQRADKLASALEATGWKPLRGQGGLFMAAAPIAYLGKEITVATPSGDRTYTLDSANISEALFYATGLLINNAVWTGIPEHCRFVLSVSDEAFEQALNCLQVFHAMI